MFAQAEKEQFVFRRLENFQFFGSEIDGRLWILVIFLVLLAAMAYNGYMYFRDGKGVGWFWATFLGTLRAAVYFLLAWAFLMPAKQLWERTETRSKVLVLLDVSASLDSRDDIPSEAVKASELPSRRDKLFNFLADDKIGFVKRLQEKNPVHLFRFGSLLDEESRTVSMKDEFKADAYRDWLTPNTNFRFPDDLSKEEREAYDKISDKDEQTKFRRKYDILVPLSNGTDLTDSVLAALNREANNLDMIQGVIVFSDGHNTQFSEQTMTELRTRADKARVPIFTVRIGDIREKIKLDIVDLSAPIQVRPEDRFPVKIAVQGVGLVEPEDELEVKLDLIPPEAKEPEHTIIRRVKLKPGNPPHGSVECMIDPNAKEEPLPGGLLVKDEKSSKFELKEGEWKLRARLAKHPKEAFDKPEHVKEVTMQIVKKPIRILLFASGPMKEFMFLKTMLEREMRKGLIDLAICLQTAKEGSLLDVPKEQALMKFPEEFNEKDVEGSGEQKYQNLAYYDLIISCDADWTKVNPEQVKNVGKWVRNGGGGLIYVAGPINTVKMIKPDFRDHLQPLAEVLPVFLDDNRMKKVARMTTDPSRLKLTPNPEFEFLRLDETDKDRVTAGWAEFFTGKKEDNAQDKAIRGFYDYYPIREPKPPALVVASFEGETLPNDKTKPMPFMVAMQVPPHGKTFFVGSAEMWRLRQKQEEYYERFWTKLCRYTSSGRTQRQSKMGMFIMNKSYRAKQQFTLDVQLLGLQESDTPKAEIRKIEPDGERFKPMTVEFKAKPRQTEEFEGWFESSKIRLDEWGKYEISLPIHNETLKQEFRIEALNLETDETTPDFAYLARLASPLTEEVKNRMDAKDNKVEAKEKERVIEMIRQTNKDNPEKPMLTFDLGTAEVIPTLTIAKTNVIESRGAVHDLWDSGFYFRDQKVSYLMLVLIGLLSLEWLTRKLLKLA